MKIKVKLKGQKGRKKHTCHDYVIRDGCLHVRRYSPKTCVFETIHTYNQRYWLEVEKIEG